MKATDENKTNRNEATNKKKKDKNEGNRANKKSGAARFISYDDLHSSRSEAVEKLFRLHLRNSAFTDNSNCTVF